MVKTNFFYFLFSIFKRPSVIALYLSLGFFSCTLPPKIDPYLANPVPETNLIKPQTIDIPDLAFYPVKHTENSLPEISAQSAIVLDLESKTLIFSKNPDQKLSPASTTKMITTLVAMKEYPLNKIIEVGDYEVIGQKMGLVSGEKMTTENLLKAALIYSANDAAETLARAHPKGKAFFITKMNEYVNDLGLKDTAFLNPIGLDQEGQFSTVHDLAHIGIAILKDPFLSQLITIKQATVSDITGNRNHNLVSTNKLLGVLDGVIGIKTGWTENAGECLVSAVKRNNHTVVIVILKSADRFADTTQLANWIFDNYQWQEMKVNLDELKEIANP